MCTENYIQVPQACSRYRAIYLESNFTFTSNILFLVMVLLSLIGTQFSVFYIYDFFNSIKISSFKCGKFHVHHILHMLHRVAVVC